MRMLFDKILGHALIEPDNTLGLLAVMCVSVALAIWLEQKYNWASKLSGAIIALVLAMAMANIGIIPINCSLYDDVVWGIVVPVGIPLLLLQCNLKKIYREAGHMLVIFLIGAVGTIVGGLAAYFLLRGPFGDAKGLAGVTAMMTGSYIGGGVNFAAMASQYSSEYTSSATVADNLLMGLYFFVLIAFSGMKFFRKNFRHPLIDEVESGSNNRESAQTQAAAFWRRKDISLKDIAINIAYAVTVVWVSNIIGGAIESLVPENPNPVMDFVGKFFGSQYVWITTISVIVATFFSKQVVEKVNGSQEIGTYLIYLFLFVIGVPANIYTVVTEAPLLLVFTFIMVVFNMVFCFGAAKIFRFNLEDAIIASNANIGGPATAAGMAVSQGWAALVGPAMLMGTLGYVLGNYAGTLIGIILGA